MRRAARERFSFYADLAWGVLLFTLLAAAVWRAAT